MKAMGENTGGRHYAGALIAACLLVSACNQRVLPESPPQPGDRAVARVNGATVWTSDVQREAVAQGLINDGAPLDRSSDLFRQMADEVIDQRLLAGEAVRRQLDRDPAVQRRLAAARERILGDALVERAVAGAVNENAIRGLYNEQVSLARQSEEFRARQIVVATQAEANQVRGELAAGGAFESLAMDRSTDLETKYNGGDMGYFTIDVMGAPYRTALQGAQTGALVGPFQTDRGWVVMRLEDRRPEQPITMSAARPQIIRFLTYDQVRDLLERLRAGARIENLLPRPSTPPGAPREPASAPRILRQTAPGASPPGTAPAATVPSAPPPGSTAGPQATGARP